MFYSYLISSSKIWRMRLSLLASNKNLCLVFSPFSSDWLAVRSQLFKYFTLAIFISIHKYFFITEISLESYCLLFLKLLAYNMIFIHFKVVLFRMNISFLVCNGICLNPPKSSYLQTWILSFWIICFKYHVSLINHN